jgi:hypothetical protein
VALSAFLAVGVAAPPAVATGGHHHTLVLRRDGSKAVQVVTVRESIPSPSQFDWGDAGIGAGAGITALLLAGAGGVAVRSRHAHRRSAPLTSGGKA